MLNHAHGVLVLSGEKREEPEVQQPQRLPLPPCRSLQRSDECPQRGFERGVSDVPKSAPDPASNSLPRHDIGLVGVRACVVRGAGGLGDRGRVGV